MWNITTSYVIQRVCALNRMLINDSNSLKIETAQNIGIMQLGDQRAMASEGKYGFNVFHKFNEQIEVSFFFF